MITTIKIISAIAFIGLYIAMIIAGASFMTVNDPDFNFTAVKIENINNQRDEN